MRAAERAIARAGLSGAGVDNGAGAISAEEWRRYWPGTGDDEPTANDPTGLPRAVVRWPEHGPE